MPRPACRACHAASLRRARGAPVVLVAVAALAVTAVLATMAMRWLRAKSPSETAPLAAPPVPVLAPPPALPPPLSAPSPDSAAASAAPASALLDRVAVIGASVTAGFNTGVMVPADGRPQRMTVDFGDAIAAVQARPTPPALEAGSILFFANPVAQGTLIAERATAVDCTLLVAVDFLFWFGYGEIEGAPLEGRLRRLDEGLALLDRFTCPIIVGDFPDMAQAVGRVLTPGQVPAPDQLEALNRRLRGWAAERPRVRVLPLAAFVADVLGARPIAIGSASWTGEQAARLLQPDRLHPTVDGMIALAIEAGVLARELDPMLTANTFVDEPAVIHAQIEQAAQERWERRREGRD